jgi:hypothetical protein
MMKQTVLKGIYFLALLGSLLVITNAIYVRWFYHDDIVEADAMLLFELDSLQNISDVIYFAESSNKTYSPYDTCAKSISELIQRQVPGVKIGTLQHGAYHAKGYLELIKNIDPGSRVNTVIVTMNLRSFGALWINSELETPLMKANVMYKKYPPIIKRMMLAFGEYDQKTWEERSRIIQYHWKHDKINVAPGFQYTSTSDWTGGHNMAGLDTFPDGTWDKARIAYACSFIMIMGFSIDANTNPRVKDFDEMVSVAKEKKLNLVFNLLPENVHYADSLGGHQLAMLMRQNRDFLVKRYNKDGVIVVDNLELVDGKNFIEQDRVNEHYDEVGRLLIATNIVNKANKYFVKK